MERFHFNTICIRDAAVECYFKPMTPHIHSMTRAAHTRFDSVDTLLRFLRLDPRRAPYRIIANPQYPLRVPLQFALMMRKGDWFDPLLIQVIPRADELERQKGFGADPVGDERAIAAPGLLHKYRNRALALVSQQCAVHCRYCFRRCLMRNGRGIERFHRGKALQYIRSHREINEIVLSGGDPLMHGNAGLKKMLDALVHIRHIDTIRIHTRVPIAWPARINKGLRTVLKTLTDTKQCFVVIHANCAQEIGDDAAEAIDGLRRCSIVLLNQSVLLKNINDTPEALAALSRRLVSLGVIPYYLHQLDRAQGAHHFEVPVQRGKQIVRELARMLGGYAVPRYVREIPGALSKTPLNGVVAHAAAHM